MGKRQGLEFYPTVFEERARTRDYTTMRFGTLRLAEVNERHYKFVDHTFTGIHGHQLNKFRIPVVLFY